jgi:hypothetical protein
MVLRRKGERVIDAIRVPSDGHLRCVSRKGPATSRETIVPSVDEARTRKPSAFSAMRL